jgi:hypothetical protein
MGTVNRISQLTKSIRSHRYYVFAPRWT